MGSGMSVTLRGTTRRLDMCQLRLVDDQDGMGTRAKRVMMIVGVGGLLEVKGREVPLGLREQISACRKALGASGLS